MAPGVASSTLATTYGKMPFNRAFVTGACPSLAELGTGVPVVELAVARFITSPTLDLETAEQFGAPYRFWTESLLMYCPPWPLWWTCLALSVL